MTRKSVLGHRQYLTAQQIRVSAPAYFRFEPLPDDGSLKIVSAGLSRVTAAKEKTR